MYSTPRIALAMFIVAFMGVVRGLWGSIQESCNEISSKNPVFHPPGNGGEKVTRDGGPQIGVCLILSDIAFGKPGFWVPSAGLSPKDCVRWQNNSLRSELLTQRILHK